jgi:hypothetical protein
VPVIMQANGTPAGPVPEDVPARPAPEVSQG